MRSIDWLTVLLLAFAAVEGSWARGAAPSIGGVLPKGDNGQSLNFDFETGTLKDWSADGEAFGEQPIEGDTVHARRADMRSGHAGKYWIGGYERSGDKPQGTLTSTPFEITHPWASFLVAGGPHPVTCVELVDNSNQIVFYRAFGHETENLETALVDLRRHQGKEIFIRVVDGHSGHWGHINFDDFRFHDEKPNVPERIQPPGPDTYRFAGLSPEDAAREMTLPEGFSVTAFAGEPDVMQPIAMALDDRGRLWIAEAYSYPRRVPKEQARDRVLIFEDTDGDGRFDKRKVFAEKLNLVSGLEVGFGGVWIGAAPQFLFIPDRDRDDRPDGPPEVLLDGWGYQDTHETLNAFIWGPDGWLYGCHGVFTHSRVGKPGTPDEQRVPLNAGIWRYHPTKHEFEVFAHGTSNPWGVDFNDRGQAFLTACVIPHLYHVIQNARYERQGGQHFNPYTYDDIKTHAVHRHWDVANFASPHAGNDRSDSAGGGHAHAGAMIYLGGSWPDKYRDQIFMNNIHGQRINMDLLAEQGSGYQGNRAPDFLLSNDRWSQILNFRYGPDGQVYMIDWYDKQACHRHEIDIHDRSNGRIFKVTYGDPQPVKVDLQNANVGELVEMQLRDNDWYVRHARRILQERGPNPIVHAALARIADKQPDETRRLRALWALHVTEGLSSAVVERALSDASPFVRGWTIQLIMESSGKRPSATMLERFVELARDDPSPVVRRYLASAAQDLPLEQRWDLLSALVVHTEDADDHNLPLLYWYAAEPLAEVDSGRALLLAAQARVPRVLSYMVRRIASGDERRGIAMLVDGVGRADDEAVQLTLLQGINRALKGRRQVDMPAAWPDVFRGLARTADPQVRSQATALALVFGDTSALDTMRDVLTDTQESVELRRQALAALLQVKDAKLAPVLQAIIADPALRREALRGLARYDDADTPSVVLAIYGKFDLNEKRDALNTLASRPSYARRLLAAVGEKQVAAGDLSADLVRQLRNLKDPRVDRLITDVWGSVRETAADKAVLIAQYKALLAQPADHDPDLALGRAVFAKTCSQCHKLFATGGSVGPELTGSNRADLEYLLSNILDPSAVMAKEYMPSLIETADGRLITGIVREVNDKVITVVTANETISLPRDNIEEMVAAEKSMMPDDIFKPLSDEEIRALVAYVAGGTQVPVLATADTVAGFFNGQNLTGWHGKADLWSVEDGQIVGRSGGLDRNEFLIGDMVLGDFRLKLQVKLTDNRGNSGIQFRSTRLPMDEVKGYQADVGAGWWGKLYEEHGRALLWEKSGESFVKTGEWNEYEIVAVGDRIRTYINGHLCVDLHDPDGARRGIIAFQLHSGEATEVRFKGFELELNPDLKLAAGE